MLRQVVAATTAGLASAFLFVSAAQANLVTNPGFESDFTDWDTSGDAQIFTSASLAFEGTKFAIIGLQVSTDDSGSIRQTVTLPSAGTYTFGAWVFLAKPESETVAGNFTQTQISMFAAGPGLDTTLGTSPNNVFSDFGVVYSEVPGFPAFDWTGWFLMSGTFLYSGLGGDTVLLNININSDFDSRQTFFAADSVFVEQVPEPNPLLLIGVGLAVLGLIGRRRAKAG